MYVIPVEAPRCIAQNSYLPAELHLAVDSVSEDKNTIIKETDTEVKATVQTRQGRPSQHHSRPPATFHRRCIRLLVR